MTRIGRLGSVLVLVVSAGCGGNPGDSVVPVTKGEADTSKAAPPATPTPLRGKSSAKLIPRSEGKR